MIRFSLALAAITLLAATPAAAQHAGHGAHPAPAKADSVKAAHDAHAAHGAHGAAAGSTSHEHMSGWKELDAYHMVMMQAWHPAKDAGNLAPARAQAAALAQHASQWAASTAPAACDTPAAREGVKKVQAGSQAFAKLVSGNAADAAVLAALRTLHDDFEAVNRGCRTK